MIRKFENYNRPLEGDAPDEAHALESDGHVLLTKVFDAEAVTRLREEVIQVYESFPPDARDSCQEHPRRSMFRYELFNRSPLSQQALAHPRILAVVEPLLGDDCHVISNTAWRNPADCEHAPKGQEWHVDGGPYIARPAGQPWPENMAYPIFVITAQIYLEPVRIEDGPTAILPTSHRSGLLPPFEQMWDLNLTYEGREADVHLAEPGDVTLFVSDTWHRRMPPLEGGTGRFFVQVAYGRREIAQRIVPTEKCSAVNAKARMRAKTARERQLLGLHDQSFYDA